LGGTIDKYKISLDVLKADLTTETPQWILSAYAPGKDTPEQLFGGIPREQSFEEMRLHYMEGKASGNEQAALNQAQELYANAQQQMQNAVNDTQGAVQFIIKAEETHPNRHDICQQGTQGQPFGVFPVGNSPFGQGTKGAQGAQAASNPFGSSNAFGAPSSTTTSSTFGQPSALGQKPSAFGAPAFGQPSQPTSTFGQPSQPSGSAFGQPSGQTTSAFGQPSQPSSGFGQPSFGQPSQPANQGSAFGQPSQPAGQTSAFGQPSQLGAKPSAFGQPAFGQPSQPAIQGSTFGQPSQPGAQGSAFGQPSQPAAQGSVFGQPSQPGNQTSAFGQPSQPANQGTAFGQPSQLGAQSNPFGQPSQPAQANPFGQPSQTGAGQANAFGQPSQLGQKPNPFASSSQPPSTNVHNPFAQGIGQPNGFASLANNQPDPNKPSHDGNAFAQQPNSGNPFGQPTQSTPAAFQSASPVAAGPDGQPPIESYASKGMDGRLSMFKGKPVSYKDDLPGIREFDGTWHRIWFPNGAPPPNKDALLPPEEYNDEMKQQWAAFSKTGKFEGGILPELPPPRDCTSWDF
jgi:nucleoporin NUP42